MGFQRNDSQKRVQSVCTILQIQCETIGLTPNCVAYLIEGSTSNWPAPFAPTRNAILSAKPPSSINSSSKLDGTIAPRGRIMSQPERLEHVIPPSAIQFDLDLQPSSVSFAAESLFLSFCCVPWLCTYAISWHDPSFLPCCRHSTCALVILGTAHWNVTKERMWGLCHAAFAFITLLLTHIVHSIILQWESS